jgi:hypothetical protein
MKRVLAVILALGLVGSVLAQTSTESLTIVGPYYQLTTSSGAIYTISGPPGTYQVTGQSMVPGLPPVNVLITITIPGSGPGPVPPPNPPPNPPPVTGKMWMVFVCDTNSAGYATAGSFQSKLWGSTTIGPALAAAPVSTTWRHYDMADPLVGTTKWGKVATQTGFPCLICVDQAGNASAVTPLPVDEVGIVAAAKKARGL